MEIVSVGANPAPGENLNKSNKEKINSNTVVPVSQSVPMWPCYYENRRFSALKLHFGITKNIRIVRIRVFLFLNF